MPRISTERRPRKSRPAWMMLLLLRRAAPFASRVSRARFATGSHDPRRSFRETATGSLDPRRSGSREMAAGDFETFDLDDDFEDVDASMEERVAAALNDVPPVPPEKRPVERGERVEYELRGDPMSCGACGMEFQCADPLKPGFLPSEKYQIQRVAGEFEEAGRLREKAESGFEWTPDEEIDYLLRGEEEEEATVEVPTEEATAICARCHGLQNHGRVDPSLRPGHTEEPLLSQEAFRELLSPIRRQSAVVIALVDLFDFGGSVLPELNSIVGEDNPVILAANKVDLLPKSMGPTRVENWIRRELDYLGVDCIGTSGSDERKKRGGGGVQLVSCKTGFGLNALLAKATKLAEKRECDIYLVGAANAGKSTLVNHVLTSRAKTRAGVKKKEPVTTSPLPGTTLKFIRIKLSNPLGTNLFDTPGLLVEGSFTQLLTPEELKMVVPKKPVESITFRLKPQKCVLVGGLASVELSEQTEKPFLFTFYVSNDIKLHPTDSSKAQDFYNNHLHTTLTPPLTSSPLSGDTVVHDLEIQGRGWEEAGADISIRGLGWISVTGVGKARVRVVLPRGIGVSVRPPLMPFDVWETASKYTGGRATRKVSKTKWGKKRSGVGRR